MNQGGGGPALTNWGKTDTKAFEFCFHWFHRLVLILYGKLELAILNVPEDQNQAGKPMVANHENLAVHFTFSWHDKC